jgi:hypothetical protein
MSAFLGPLARKAVVALFGFFLILPCSSGKNAASQPQSAQSSSSSASPRIKTIYIIPSSHWDLGFLAPPEEILTRLKPHIDEVIRNAKADPEFRWTIESVWQIREWLSRTHDPQEIKDFVSLVNKGQIQISAVFGSMHTEFMGAEALNRITYDMKDLEKKLDVKTDFAMMDDVPGFTSRLPQVLARSGVRYFATGSNLFLFGGTSLTPAKMPFYWESPDGSRILAWQTQSRFGGYTEAMADYFLDPAAYEPYTKEHFYPKEWEGLPPLEIMQRGVDKLLAKYEQANYAHDSLMLLYLHDFISSNLEEKQLLPAVRAWNAAGKQPRIVVATPREFFEQIEAASGKDSFPSYMGDWSGLWSEVKTNSPVVSAGARWLQDHWPVAESLWSLLTFREGTNLPAGNLEEARIQLYKYEEHSGAAQVGWPKLMTRTQVDQQNAEYVRYIQNGKKDIEYLLESGLETLLSQKPTKTRTVAVYNPLSWSRSEAVRFESKDDLVLRRASDGRIAPTQRISPEEIAFFAADVPAMGYVTFTIEKDVPSARPQPILGVFNIESTRFRVRVRPEDGSIASLVDRESGRELVDPSAGKSFNELLRWIPPQTFAVQYPSVTASAEHGPVFDRLTIRRPGSYWPETQITLYRGSEHVEVSNWLDRDKMPFVASNQPGEYYSFQFSFSFEGSAQVWVEDGIGFHRIPDDYLPGARTDAAAPLHGLVLAGKKAGQDYHITLSQREAFFDYLLGLPGAKGPNTFLNTVRAAALRKQDQGETRDVGMVNFSTVEPGLPAVSSYQFAVSSGPGGLCAVSSYREAAEFNLPMIAVELHGAEPAKPTGSYFSLDAENVGVLAFKPSADGNPEHYTLRLQEIAGKAGPVTVTTPLKITAVERTNLTEDVVFASTGESLLGLHIGPHETLTLRLTIPHPHKTRSERWWEW